MKKGKTLGAVALCGVVSFSALAGNPMVINNVDANQITLENFQQTYTLNDDGKVEIPLSKTNGTTINVYPAGSSTAVSGEEDTVRGYFIFTPTVSQYTVVYKNGDTEKSFIITVEYEKVTMELDETDVILPETAVQGEDVVIPYAKVTDDDGNVIEDAYKNVTISVKTKSGSTIGLSDSDKTYTDDVKFKKFKPENAGSYIVTYKFEKVGYETVVKTYTVTSSPSMVKDTTLSFKLNSTIGTPVIGSEFSVPKVTVTDKANDNSDAKAKVVVEYSVMNEQGESSDWVRIENYKFTPKLEGYYSFKYTVSDAYGNTAPVYKVQLSTKVTDTSAPTNLKYVQSYKLVDGEAYLTDSDGDLKNYILFEGKNYEATIIESATGDKEFTVVINNISYNDIVESDAKGEFVKLNIEGSGEQTYYIKNQKAIDVSYDIKENVVLGNDLFIPAIVATDNSGSENLEYDRLLRRYENGILAQTIELDTDCTKAQTIKTGSDEDAKIKVAGTYKLTYVVTDSNGNQTTKDFEITVRESYSDVTAPEVTFPSSIVESTKWGTTVSISKPTVSDNDSRPQLIAKYYYTVDGTKVNSTETEVLTNSSNKYEFVLCSLQEAETVLGLNDDVSKHTIKLVFSFEAIDDVGNTSGVLTKEIDVIGATDIPTVNYTVSAGEKNYISFKGKNYEATVTDTVTAKTLTVTIDGKSYTETVQSDTTGEFVELDLEGSGSAQTYYIKHYLQGSEINVGELEISYSTKKYRIAYDNKLYTGEIDANANTFTVKVDGTAWSETIQSDSSGKYIIHDTTRYDLQEYSDYLKDITVDIQVKTVGGVEVLTYGAKYNFTDTTLTITDAKFYAVYEGDYDVVVTVKDINGNVNIVSDKIKGVSKVYNPEIRLDNETLTLELGDSDTSAKIYTLFNNGKQVEATEKNIKITVSDSSVVSLDSNSYFVAHSAGSCIVTYTMYDDEGVNELCSKTINITVEDTEKPTMVFEDEDMFSGSYRYDSEDEDKNKVYLPIPSVSDLSGTGTVSITVTHNSSDQDIKTDSEGKYFLIKEDGSYTIKYAVNDNSGNETTKSFTLNVGDVDGPVISVKNVPASLEVGSIYTLDVDNDLYIYDDYEQDAFDKAIGTRTTITMKDADGNEIKRIDNESYSYKFDTAGTYTLTIKSKDSTDHSTTIEKTIVVSEAEEEPANASNTAGTVIAIIASLAILALVVWYFFKPEKDTKKSIKENKKDEK